MMTNYAKVIPVRQIPGILTALNTHSHSFPYSRISMMSKRVDILNVIISGAERANLMFSSPVYRRKLLVFFVFLFYQSPVLDK